MIHGGDIEPVTKGNKSNAERVRLIVHALSDRFTAESTDVSTHFRVPGAIGSAAVPHEIILERTDEAQLVAQHGFNLMGDYE